MTPTIPSIPVKGVSIHGKDLKKLFEYYFEIFTRWDAHDMRYQNVSRLERPINPYDRESMTISSCIRCLGLQDEYREYFDKRRLVDPYWVERDAPKVDPLVEYFKRNPEKNDLWQ